MPEAILLSIKPEFAKSIFEGEKEFEFRKAVPKNSNVKKVYVYASAPCSRVIGTFIVAAVIEGRPEDLWEKTSKGAGISQEYFNQYFEGRNKGFAIKVDTPELFKEHRSLVEMFGFKMPPQSFRYVVD